MIQIESHQTYIIHPKIQRTLKLVKGVLYNFYKSKIDAYCCYASVEHVLLLFALKYLGAFRTFLGKQQGRREKVN